MSDTLTLDNKIDEQAPLAISPRGSARLVRCDLAVCEARCCYDGVYLESGEERKIRDVVASSPESFPGLPPDFIVDGSWGGRVSGRKTAVRPHEYASPEYPAHFSRTRCVFCTDDHKCMLQMLAVERGLHKWAYKPRSCWMFPLDIVDGVAVPPPRADEPDPHCLGDEYPGYVKFVPCGQDRPDGDPWEETLSEEIEYWRSERREDSVESE